MEEQFVQVPEQRYHELIAAEIKLNKLEAAGVDNWNGYDWAMEENEDD